MPSDLNTNSANNGTKTERFEYEEATVLTLLQSYRSLTEQHNYEDAFAVANNCVHVAINTPDLKHFGFAHTGRENIFSERNKMRQRKHV